MPFYDFVCQDCGHPDEEFLTIKEMESLVRDGIIDCEYLCKKCGGYMKKVITAPMVAVYDMATPEQKKEILARRSKEHFQKKIEDEFHYKNRRGG